jgi:hypothetical protein
MTKPVSAVIPSDLVATLVERTGVKSEWARKRLGQWSVTLVLNGAADDVPDSLRVMANLFALYADRRGVDLGVAVDSAVKRRAREQQNRASYR